MGFGYRYLETGEKRIKLNECIIFFLNFVISFLVGILELVKNCVNISSSFIFCNFFFSRVQHDF